MIIDIDPNGYASCGEHRWRCALGKGGLHIHKREGDGITPVGEYALGRVFYRPDRNPTPPETGLETYAIDMDWGWCDDPDHPDYNTLITLPHPAHHERLWRDDDLYDVVVEVLYNSAPIIAGRGSAIFMHIAKPDYAPTEGCIALKKDDLLALLRMCTEPAWVRVPAANAD